MKYLELDELLRQAENARDLVGASAAAERLVVFKPIVDALGDFVRREGGRVIATQTLREKKHELSAAIRDIERNYRPEGPTISEVQRFYRAATQFTVALNEFDKFSQPIDPKRPYELEK